MTLYRNRPAAFWLLLAGAMILVAIISLSAHVLMLQGLGVPFPDRSAVRWWAALLNVALAVFAFAIFYRAATPQLRDCPAWARWLIVAALFGALKELLRGGVMNGVVTTGWTVSFAQLIAPVIYSLVLSGFVVFALSRVRGPWALAAGALGTAAIMTFAVKPLTGLALSPLMASIASLRHADVYPFPYGWHVLVWAYITYLEPVIACCVAAALVLPGLSARPFMQVSQFTLLILAIKGTLLPTFLFGFTNSLGVWAGMLSESQFLAEGILLAMPVAALWQFAFDPPHAGRAY